MDVMTSISVGEESLSLTVVMQPSRKDSQRLSFPGTLPFDRTHTDDSAATQNRFSFYSDDSGAGSSDLGHSFDAVYATELDGNPELFCEAPENSVLSWLDMGSSPRDEIMQRGDSNESQVDPTLTLRNDSNITLTAHPAIEWGGNSDLQSFPTALEPVHKSNNNLLNLFPLPPSFQGTTTSDHFFNKMSGMSRQDGALACIKRNQIGPGDPVLPVFDERNAFFDLNHITSHSYNAAEISRGFESFPELNPMALRLPSLDFETYRGLVNDMRYSKISFDPREMDRIMNGPLPMEPLSLEAGPSSVALCHQPTVFTQEVEEGDEYRSAPVKEINLEKAQLCIVKDELGKDVYFKDVVQHRRTAVIFLRHFGSPQSQECVKKISSNLAPSTPARKAIDKSNTQIVFIGSGSWKLISNYTDSLDPLFKFYTDSTTTSKLFRKMGLHRSLLEGTLWETVVGSSGGKLRQKYKQKSPINETDSITQLRGIICFESVVQDVPLTGGNRRMSILKLKADTKAKRITTKFSMKISKTCKKKYRRSQVSISEGNPDPFRRSFVGAHSNISEKDNPASVIKCAYVYRINRSSENDVPFCQLFRSIGLSILKHDSSSEK